MQGNVHATLAIREFRSPEYLHQGAIVYKTSPEQIGNFSQVKLYDGRPDINYVLSGRLEKLDEIDYEGGVKVEVAISAQLVQLSTGATVWSNSVTEVGQVEKRDVPAVVSGMNRTMDEAIEKLLTPGPATCSCQAATTSTPRAE